MTVQNYIPFSLFEFQGEVRSREFSCLRDVGESDSSQASRSILVAPRTWHAVAAAFDVSQCETLMPCSARLPSREHFDNAEAGINAAVRCASHGASYTEL